MFLYDRTSRHVIGAPSYLDVSFKIPAFDSKQDLMDQICLDINIVFEAFRNTMVNTLKVLAPSYINDLPPPEVATPNLSFSQKMQFIEKKIAAIFSFSILFAKIFAEKTEIGEEISKANDTLTINFNMAAYALFEKYKKVFADRIDEDLFLVRDCYSPGDFEECDGVNQETMRLFYRQSLIVYANTPTPITITFRDEGRGWGAFFDHYNIQRITGRRTEISLPQNFNVVDFYHTTTQTSLVLKGTNAHKGKVVPAVSDNRPDAMGLLIIPGYSRNTPEKRPLVHQQRVAHEVTMIKNARHFGQPVLAICGGLWTLIQAIGGTTKPVSNHTGTMPELLEDGEIELGQNKGLRLPIHPLKIYGDSRLARLMGYEQQSASHNIRALSVHWLAANTIPKDFKVSATTESENEGLVIEAIENCDPSSASIVGIQGHPEAMRENHPNLQEAAYRHHRLIQNLAVEGDIYHKRLVEVKEQVVMKLSFPEFLRIFEISRDNYRPVKAAIFNQDKRRALHKVNSLPDDVKEKSSSSSSSQKTAAAATTSDKSSFSNSKLQPTKQQPDPLPAASASASSSANAAASIADKEKAGDAKTQKQAADIDYNTVLQAQLERLEALDLQTAIKNSLNEKENKSHVEKLKVEAQKFGFTCKDVKRDGFCLLYAIEDQLNQLSTRLKQQQKAEVIPSYTYEKLKEILIKHIIDNINIYKNYSTLDANSLAAQVLDYKWASDTGDFFTLALSRALDVTIFVIPNDGSKPKVFRRPDRPAIFLGYESGKHYQSLVPREKLETPQKRQFEQLIRKCICDEKPDAWPAVAAEKTSSHAKLPLVAKVPITSGISSATPPTTSTVLAVGGVPIHPAPVKSAVDHLKKTAATSSSVATTTQLPTFSEPDFERDFLLDIAGLPLSGISTTQSPATAAPPKL